jgi:hypothetical protein
MENIMVKTTQVLSTAEEKGLEDTVENSGNYQPVKFNAMTHGILSRHTVLPHENRDEYNDLQLLLVQEHQPQGMTEAHLVEELAGTIWRKQRVLQAEGAKINEGLNAISGRSGSVYSNSLPFHSGMSKDDIKLYDLLRMIPDEVIDFQQTSSEELNNILEAVRLLEADGAGYNNALNLMCEEDREWWEVTIEDEENQATEEDLLAFILAKLKPWYEHQLTVATHHAEIKAQAFGEGVRSDRLVFLNRYETHLDRKFQRTLAMLIKMKELRND